MLFLKSSEMVAKKIRVETISLCIYNEGLVRPESKGMKIILIVCLSWHPCLHAIDVCFTDHCQAFWTRKKLLFFLIRDFRLVDLWMNKEQWDSYNKTNRILTCNLHMVSLFLYICLFQEGCL